MTISVNTFILILLLESVATPLIAPAATKQSLTKPVPWHPTIWFSGVNDAGTSEKYAVVHHCTLRHVVALRCKAGM